MVSGCGGAADPTAVTSGNEPVPAERSIQSWWRQLTDTTGFVEGRILYPDGRPVVHAGIGCVAPSGERGTPDIGHVTDENGHYRCGGKPGSITLEVYDPVVGGLLYSQEAKITARNITHLDLVVRPTNVPATPTAIEKSG
jgi:hypothetical protein